MKSNSELAVYARMFWIMVGPAILLLLLLSIANRGSGWIMPHDIAYLTVLGLVLFARWYEFRENPTTAAGEPATSADLRKYLLSAAVIGVGLWFAANSFGNFFLNH